LLAAADDAVVPLVAVNGMYGGGTFKVSCAAPDMSGTCQLDTGLNVSYFSSGAFSTLPPSLGTATYTSVTGSVIQCDYVSLASIRLGDTVELGSIEPVVCPEEKNKSQTNLLGLDVFAGRSFVLDAPKSQLVLLENPAVLANSFQVDNVGHILISVQSGFQKPREVLAMFDTGAAISTVDMELVKAQPENFTVIETHSVGTDAFGNPINSSLVIGSLQVGDVKIFAKYFIAMDFSAFQTVSDAKIQMILGYNVIAGERWSINMADRTWAAE